MISEDLVPAQPALQIDGRLSCLSTEVKPTVASDGTALEVGTELREEDTGRCFYWTGAWTPVAFTQKLDQLVEVCIEIRNLLLLATE